MSANNASRCLLVYREPLLAMSSWVQHNVKVMCAGNLATQICDERHCDTIGALEILDELGYFLGTYAFSDDIFCR